MSIPLPPPLLPAPCHGRAATGGGRRAAILLLFAIVAAFPACAGRQGAEITADVVRRDRVARAEIEAAIAEDHVALADLITSDRFAELETVYADPELRAIALRLTERSRSLEQLDETNVLAPGTP
ncbi:MAG: hypothetical protein R3F21_11035 [Myxococcota bacterium]